MWERVVRKKEGEHRGSGGRSERRNRVSDVFRTPDMAGEFLEVSLERLVGVRAWRSQILRERDPLKLQVHKRTWLEEVLRRWIYKHSAPAVLKERKMIGSHFIGGHWLALAQSQPLVFRLEVHCFCMLSSTLRDLAHTAVSVWICRWGALSGSRVGFLMDFYKWLVA